MCASNTHLFEVSPLLTMLVVSTASALVAKALPIHGFISQVAIIIAVYYVVRFSRHNTDAFVTRVFFAARDRRLRVLRQAIGELDEIQSPSAIAPFIVDYLRDHTGITARVFYQDDDSGYIPVAGCAPDVPPLGRDTVAVVALRTRREPTTSRELQFLGELAFPMLVRGRLRGIMICTAPNDGELAPDEIDTLAAIANRVAGDRDDLLAEELRRENETLRTENIQLRRINSDFPAS